MTDYQGLWLGFLVLFGALPALAGAGLGLLWGLRRGRRGSRLLAAALFGAGAAGLIVFAGAVVLFRA